MQFHIPELVSWLNAYFVNNNNNILIDLIRTLNIISQEGY